MWKRGASFSVVATIALGVLVGGMALAQGTLREVFSPQPSDSDVVLVADGEPLLRGALRTTVDLALAKGSNSSRDQLTREALAAMIQTRAAIAKAKSLGSDPSQQAFADIESAQAACSRDDSGLPCRDLIAAQGLSWDEFWQEQRVKYENAVLVTELVRRISAERGVDVSTYEKWSAFEKAYLQELAAQADIVWHDLDLERLYKGS